MSLNTLEKKTFAALQFSKKDLLDIDADGKIVAVGDFYAPLQVKYPLSRPLEAVKDGDITYCKFEGNGLDFCEIAATASVEGDFLFYLKSDKVPNILISYADGEYFYGKSVSNSPTSSYNGPAYKELRINGVVVNEDTCGALAEATLNKFSLIEFRGLIIPKTTWRFGGYKDAPDYSWSGLVGHAYLTHSALTDIEIAELEARILQNYNKLDLLPDNHPFKTGVASYDRTIIGRAPAVKITSWLKPKVSIVDFENGQEVKKLTNVQADGSFMYDTDSQQEVRAVVTYELTQESINIEGNDEDYAYIKALDHAIDGTASDDDEKNKDAQIAELNTQIQNYQAQVAELQIKLTTAENNNATLTEDKAKLQTSLDVANARIDNASAYYMFLEETLILSSQHDVAAAHFYTNIPSDQLTFKYSQADKSTIIITANGELYTHYVAGTTNHSTVTIYHNGAEVGTITFNTTSSASIASHIVYAAPNV